MEKIPTQLIIITMTSLFSLLTVATHEDLGFVTTMDKRLVGLGEEKLTRLRLYWHDVVSGPRPTSVQIIPPLASSSARFGLVQMIDNPLTMGLGLNSTIVGRAQGIYGQASLEGVAFLVAMNLAFTRGKYNGSSIAVIGRNPMLSPTREMPVVGGSGLFRFARGYALLRTRVINPKTEDAAVEYDISVLHY